MINRGRIYFLYLLLFCSCRCPQGFYVDNGKNWKKDGKFERYTSIEDQDFVISVHKYNEEITINYLTKFNAPALVKERGVKITFNQAILRLDNTIVREIIQKKVVKKGGSVPPLVVNL